jgi:UDP-N-acetylmuramoyl-tripeptide--D-alanyl-D-alanine ligase
MATPIPENQARFTLADVVRATGGRLVRGDEAQVVTGVAIDSRAVNAGGLFVAIRGETQDGARYLPQVIAAGAACVLVHAGTEAADGCALIEVSDTTFALGELARFHRTRWGGQVVAITGSAGKTTTKELTAGAFSALGARVLKTQGNLNNQFGVPMTVFCLGASHDLAVLELGTSGRGEIARLGQIVSPDVSVVILAALAHTAGIGTLADVADEKASLFGALGANGVAVVNADDENLMARTRADVRTLSFGTSEKADVQLVSSQLSVTGTEATVRVGEQQHELSLALIGHAAALDASAALASVVALHGKDALEQASQGLAQVAAAPGRMVIQPGPDGVFLIDDTYNANPRSMAAALESLSELAKARGARSLAVLGAMKELGPLSPREHAQVGELAVRLGIDVLVGAGPDMAHATAAAARLSAGRLAPHPTRVAHVLAPLDAVPIARSLWRSGDIVLVKGSRSMAMEQVLSALLEARGSAREENKEESK